MSVTFNRAQLVKVANDALAEHAKAGAAYDQAVQEYLVNHAQAHTERTRERATALRNAITKALKKSGPVLSDDLRKAIGDTNYLNERFYTPPQDYDIRKNVTKAKGLMTLAEVTEARALLRVLEAAEGETVSVNELKLLGLKNLQPVFIAAAQEAGK